MNGNQLRSTTRLSFFYLLTPTINLLIRSEVDQIPSAFPHLVLSDSEEGGWSMILYVPLYSPYIIIMGLVRERGAGSLLFLA